MMGNFGKIIDPLSVAALGHHPFKGSGFLGGNELTIRTAATALAAFGFLIIQAHADDQSTWLAARQAAFTQWAAAHPKLDAEIVDLKTKAAVPLRGLPALDQASLEKPSVSWPVAGGLKELWDDPAAPQMVVISPGEFTMGAFDNEPGRYRFEIPRHRVRIAYPFAVAKYDVTLAEFQNFVKDTEYQAGNQCYSFENSHKGEEMQDRNWHNPGYKQTPDQPVTCITWDAAKAYAVWLSNKTGHNYRLLSEAEYEYVSRAGTTTLYFWGNDPDKGLANCDGCNTAKPFGHPSPVGSFPPNPFGLYDTTGNVWSWVQDCWLMTYQGAPVDGSPAANEQCDTRGIRGGGWHNDPGTVRSAVRVFSHPWHEDQDVGFRLARVL